ncbi:uncharacterized protein LOC127806738 [Diospyros lotus]|uniref:uncharacterized protein LOC127806738 n=1 Tax=Diospyros lotus TaxID=55363 RepID=UPI00225A0694|nr:uncharacterized protein LOC127806738 [Diospyros lotus]
MKMEETVTRHLKETTSTTTMSMAAKGQQVEAAKKTKETEFPLHNDFDRFWTWHREEDKDTLVVQLPEFKAEELKVRINNSGNLTISGERPIINGKGRVRFTKEMKLSKKYDASNITAKFTKDGLLHVTLPKKIPNSGSDAGAADFQLEEGGESGRAGAGAKAALNVAVAAAAVAALAVGVYETFKRGTSSSSADSSSSSAAAHLPVSSNM